MKKIATILLSIVMIFSTSACGSQSSENSSSISGTGQEETKPQNTATENFKQNNTETGNTDLENTDQENTQDTSNQTDAASAGKTLVVYYSATGNTKEAGDYIAEALDADIFELEPEEPYSDADLDWTNDSSRVVYEHDHPQEREVALISTTVPDWESYETVFIGYPIWWGIAAWPVDGFIKANDFTGKTVVPFCTSSSSGLGESGTLLEEAAGTGNWLEGKRFSSGDSKETIQNWADSLDLAK